MPQLNLLPEEASKLREMLEDYLSDLRMEISNTDSMEFRNGLKQREELLKKVILELAPAKAA